MGVTAKGVKCGVVEWVKCGALRWIGHVMRIGENEFVKRVYEGRIEGGDVRGRPPVKWIIRVSEYWCERVGSSWITGAERECQNRERWRHFCHSHSLEGSSYKEARPWRYK